MKDWEDKIMMAFYGLFGAGAGFAIFAIPLNGWELLVTKGSVKPWNGLLSLVLCTGLGFGWGIVAYKFRDREFGDSGSSFYHDEATARLFIKRVMVIATCLAALYFLWQAARRL